MFEGLILPAQSCDLVAILRNCFRVAVIPTLGFCTNGLKKTACIFCAPALALDLGGLELGFLALMRWWQHVITAHGPLLCQPSRMNKPGLCVWMWYYLSPKRGAGKCWLITSVHVCAQLCLPLMRTALKYKWITLKNMSSRKMKQRFGVSGMQIPGLLVNVTQCLTCRDIPGVL